ncbi:helix-turn-helix protein [Volucribacter psittacicida]|uniref:Helix-turn-helix protein n=1 Tax=Volucribacter psittacicida TaxID=203482 RepID=A0A4R1FRI2_9PAST|nr:helix-turn-helix domain-containing protein [Volucribacter psittacicida]TCJ96172.1 helix-turn-helix protein [Volucribacter psittacicida]
MSMLLMVKAMNCKVGNSARKLVLLKLADNANDDGVCFPSYQFIADKCEMTRRSAISHINALIEMGLVSKTLRQNKDGSSSNLYQLHLDQVNENCSFSSEDFAPEGVKNLHEGSENYVGGSSENFAPITSNSINQSINHKKINKKSSPEKSDELEILQDFGITDQLAKDFITHRKAKKAPITITVMEGFQREADKAKIPITKAVETSINRGWRGFSAEWLVEKNKPQNKPSKPDTHNGFNKRHYGETKIPDWAKDDVKENGNA